ncbi:voltage-gated potassium channel [Candidatus Magnetomoraceae bacterium gMMP-15]
MERTLHLITTILFSIIIVFTGTTGYMWIEGWNFMDALYMTVITLGTVGYGEVHKLSNTGHLFTIVLIFIGVGFCAYVASAVIQFTVEGRIRMIMGRRRLEKQIKQLRDHYIICGYGRIGRVVYRHLMHEIPELVVIEQNPDTVPVMDEDGILYISGPATEEKNLIRAGIKRAGGLVAVLGKDTDNVFLVLTARQLNSELFIVARAGEKATKKTLHAAGADKVISPYDIGAIRIAQVIIRPTVVSFLDYACTRKGQDINEDIQMEEFPVDTFSSFVGVKLHESGIRQKFNLIIIAIKKNDNTMLFNPSSETRIEAGDTLIAVGERETLIKFEKVLNP